MSTDPSEPVILRHLRDMRLLSIGATTSITTEEARRIVDHIDRREGRINLLDLTISRLVEQKTRLENHLDQVRAHNHTMEKELVKLRDEVGHYHRKESAESCQQLADEEGCGAVMGEVWRLSGAWD